MSNSNKDEMNKLFLDKLAESHKVSLGSWETKLCRNILSISAHAVLILYINEIQYCLLLRYIKPILHTKLNRLYYKK